MKATIITTILTVLVVLGLAFTPSCVSKTTSMLDPSRQVTAEELRWEAEKLRADADREARDKIEKQVREAEQEASKIKREADAEAARLARELRKNQLSVQTKLLEIDATHSQALSQLTASAEMEASAITDAREELLTRSKETRDEILRIAQDSLVAIRKDVEDRAASLDARLSVGLQDIQRKDEAKGALFAVGEQALGMSPLGPIAGLLGISTLASTLFGVRAKGQQAAIAKEAEERGWKDREAVQKEMDAQWDALEKRHAERLAALMTPPPPVLNPVA